jgi:hypothetical protein
MTEKMGPDEGKIYFHLFAFFESKYHLNVIHDIWTQKMQKGENIFFPHLDPFSQSWSNILI